ncbi:hypothetical protein D3C75_538410 [compost metagenome]
MGIGLGDKEARRLAAAPLRGSRSVALHVPGGNSAAAQQDSHRRSEVDAVALLRGKQKIIHKICSPRRNPGIQRIRIGAAEIALDSSNSIIPVPCACGKPGGKSVNPSGKRCRQLQILAGNVPGIFRPQAAQ